MQAVVLATYFPNRGEPSSWRRAGRYAIGGVVAVEWRGGLQVQLERERTLKISNGVESTNPLERPGPNQANAPRPRSPADAAAGPEATDTIRISDLSNQLAALESRFAADGAFDAARVDTIKSAMREGRFVVNPEVVADRLIESVRELLRKPS